MNILITGAKGFIGKNLAASLENIRTDRDRTRRLSIGEIFLYDRDTDPRLLRMFCEKADFVFNLAGVNRPVESSEFMESNHGFTLELLNELRARGNKCPVMLASSVQASLADGCDGSSYGKSKLACERSFFEYARETGARVLVYRFPNVFGKWCRPDYNSVIATFCSNMARGKPIVIYDRNAMMELVYIDDLVNELLDALEGKEHRCEFVGEGAVAAEKGSYCCVPVTHRTTVGEIADLIEQFRIQAETLTISEMPKDSFEWKLYSTYFSYLPPSRAAYKLNTSRDRRGSFTELVKSAACGQVSVSVIEPNETKGKHWHHSKSEIFFVTGGRGLICQRKIGSDDVTRYEVSGDVLKAVRILPGYTHSITNLSSSEPLVAVIWASEQFDPEHPDTFFEEV